MFVISFNCLIIFFNRNFLKCGLKDKNIYFNLFDIYFIFFFLYFLLKYLFLFFLYFIVICKDGKYNCIL